jgi:hypothetical protein
MLMVGLFGLTGVAAVATGTEPRTTMVTEPDGSLSVLGHGPEVFNTSSGFVAARMEPSFKGGSASGSVTVGQYHHHSAAYWNWRYRTMRHLAYLRHNRIRQLKRTLMSSPSVSEAINLAAVVYGNGPTLWRRARCESKLNPNAKNGSEASGLLQFLPSTWATTPFSRFSVFSPYANALAAGWMIGPAGRGSEWSCS